MPPPRKPKAPGAQQLTKSKQSPAELLLTKPNLAHGWRVTRKISKTAANTGGKFSVGYVVVNENGREGFLKALDLSEALGAPDVVKALSILGEAYLHERNLLELCRSKNLNHVASTISHGQIASGVLHDTLPVPYLIFELANGDIRSKLDLGNRFELAFCLRALHHCTVGINQLHAYRIAHQDLKPSNVLVFGNSFCRVSDLGRSTILGVDSPNDQLRIPGDARYAPPELLYGSKSTEWNVGRAAGDLYHLGSLAFFFFVKVGITPVWLTKLTPALQPFKWTQTYNDVLPFVRGAHDQAIEELENQVPIEVRGDIIECVRQLCDPDPLLRGHPKNRGPHSNPYSLERYITRFDLLARRAEWQMKRSLV